MTNQKRFTPESLLDMRGVSDPQIAPDGVRVAYVEHWIETITKDDRERPVYRSAIMLSAGPEAEPRRLTWSKTANESQPRWSPDGQSLAFISTRDDDKPQLFVIDLEGGEASPVTTTKTLSEGVGGYDWHPEGQAFCLISSGHITDDDRKERKVHDEKVYEGRLPIKFDGSGLLDPERTQLWRVGRDGQGLAQLTHDDRDIESPRWSPDGEQIAYITVAQPEHERTALQDIFVYSLETRQSRQLTQSRGPLQAPVWDESGQRLAFLGHQQRRGNATNTAVWVIDVHQGEPRCLTEGFDRSAGSTTMGDIHFGSNADRVVWNDDTLFFTATDHGRTGIYRVPLVGGEVEQISTSGLSALTFTLANHHIAFNGETNTRIPEVFTVTTDGRALARRSHAADGIASQFLVSTPEHVTFKGAEGWDIEGWVMKPTEYQEGQTYPLLLYIHGGPHMDYGNGFFHEFQVLANAGFGVFYTNPRGGHSYGEAFTDAVRQHFGEGDYEDLMHATDLAASWSWVDPKRMGVMGGSYGGFMTNWIISHTDRFAAACTQRSISNLLSFAGTSDIGPVFSADEYGALPWTNEEQLMAKSPIRYVKNIKTPTLILHQENDHRCPMEQAEQLYTALVCLGVPTKFVRFPDEDHNMSRSGQPQRRINRMHHIIDWFDRYLKG